MYAVRAQIALNTWMRQFGAAELQKIFLRKIRLTRKKYRLR